MNWPTSVKIGAHVYTLEFLTHWEGSDDELAFTRYGPQEIVICSSLAETQKFSTLVHESMHAMNPQLDHQLLSSLAEQIAQFLLDNKFVNLEDEPS